MKQHLNPWVRLWIVIFCGLSVYWIAFIFYPLVREYSRIPTRDAYVFLGNYLYEMIAVAQSGPTGYYRDITVKVAGIGPYQEDFTCHIPKDAVDCMNKDTNPLMKIELDRKGKEIILPIKKAVVANERIQRLVEETCGITVTWFLGVTLRLSENIDVRQCVSGVVDLARSRQQEDIRVARRYVLKEGLDQAALLAGASLVAALVLAAISWVVRGFRSDTGGTGA